MASSSVVNIDVFSKDEDVGFIWRKRATTGVPVLYCIYNLRYLCVNYYQHEILAMTNLAYFPRLG